MTFDQIQPYVAAQLAEHAAIAGAGIPILEDDGSWPQSPGREAALKSKGLVFIVWQIDGEQITSSMPNGFHAGDLYVPVVVESNTKANMTATGAQIRIERAVEYGMQAVVGRPLNLGLRRFKLLEQPFKNFGKINGVNRMVINFAFPFDLQPA